MEAPQIFLAAVAILNIVNALLAWFSSPTFIALNGFDQGAKSLLIGHGMCLSCLASATAAPAISGTKATKLTCRFWTVAYAVGVIICATGGNYVLLGQSAVICAGCAFFGSARCGASFAPLAQSLAWRLK